MGDMGKELCKLQTEHKTIPKGLIPWKPGQSGNPKGKRPGPNNLTAEFRRDMLQAYRERGGIQFLKDLPIPEFAAMIRHMVPKAIEADLHLSGAIGVVGMDLSGLPVDELRRLAHATGEDFEALVMQVGAQLPMMDVEAEEVEQEQEQPGEGEGKP